jgi:hypothetical protein
MADLNVPTDRMVLIFDCKVKDVDAFKTWSKDRAAKYVYELKEENSISYEWHISDDGAEATLIESFVDSDAMMVRLANHSASPLAAEVMELVDFKSILCLGNAKKMLLKLFLLGEHSFVLTILVIIEG